MDMRMRLSFVVSAASCLAWSACCFADIDPLTGIDFVRIGAVGNAPWAGDGTAGDRAIGRGQVNYEYNIGKYEVTSAQWADFFSAAFDRAPGDTIPHLTPPTFWGGVPTTPTHTENPSAMRWTTTAQSAMLPTGNISWRMAAIYTNWLCNGISSERSAFLNGAYDVSTFTYNPNGSFNDQITHTPGAAYYIPTWDEWLKAAHYDPNKQNPNGTTGGWWRYGNGSDQPFIGALPNVGGTANFGFDTGAIGVPLGAYNVTSPFGLRDVAGGTAEWVEEAFYRPLFPLPSDRYYEGSHWTSQPVLFADQIQAFGGGDFPSLSTLDLGFRIAHVVPAPSWCSVGAGLLIWSAVRRRRNHDTRNPCSNTRRKPCLRTHRRGFRPHRGVH